MRKAAPYDPDWIPLRPKWDLKDDDETRVHHEMWEAEGEHLRNENAFQQKYMVANGQIRTPTEIEQRKYKADPGTPNASSTSDPFDRGDSRIVKLKKRYPGTNRRTSACRIKKDSVSKMGRELRERRKLKEENRKAPSAPNSIFRYAQSRNAIRRVDEAEAAQRNRQGSAGGRPTIDRTIIPYAPPPQGFVMPDLDEENAEEDNNEDDDDVEEANVEEDNDDDDDDDDNGSADPGVPSPFIYGVDDDDSNEETDGEDDNGNPDPHTADAADNDEAAEDSDDNNPSAPETPPPYMRPFTRIPLVNLALAREMITPPAYPSDTRKKPTVKQRKKITARAPYLPRKDKQTGQETTGGQRAADLERAMIIGRLPPGMASPATNVNLIWNRDWQAWQRTVQGELYWWSVRDYRCYKVPIYGDDQGSQAGRPRLRDVWERSSNE